MPGQTFEKQQLIRFHHCDPAGIVFYPQYLILFDELLEDWFNEGMDLDFASFVARERVGTPAVRLECDFLAPSKIGDLLTLRLGVQRLGNSSFTLLIEGVCGGQTRIRCVQVRVFAALDKLRGIPIPAELRPKMARFVVPDASNSTP